MSQFLLTFVGQAEMGFHSTGWERKMSIKVGICNGFFLLISSFFLRCVIMSRNLLSYCLQSNGHQYKLVLDSLPGQCDEVAFHNLQCIVRNGIHLNGVNLQLLGYYYGWYSMDFYGESEAARGRILSNSLFLLHTTTNLVIHRFGAISEYLVEHWCFVGISA